MATQGTDPGNVDTPNPTTNVKINQKKVMSSLTSYLIT